jgi:hypothetical protein
MAKYLSRHARITRIAVCLCTTLLPEPGLTCALPPQVEELILDEVVNKSKLGVAITSALRAGLVLPDGLIVSLLRKRLSRAVADDVILLDGFPSSASLVEAVDQHVS